MAFGKSAADAGLLMIPMSVGVISGSYLAGKGIARTGIPEWNPVVGMTFSSVMFQLMGSVHEHMWFLSVIACGLVWTWVQ
ncbi:MFS transporter [Vibrio sp. V39_P1S14PM300]|uniref:MFS transporter n=1 Tax=Vibrio sp. V39_P1S14PM300 TaxID=1938690 RepID=UPI00137312BB|nr:MFS transporter [Vibrio sp. V39_P1S14PM300]NAX21587.1 hypothetical protein [Vibrio sp. V39_P1S14PM300]